MAQWMGNSGRIVAHDAVASRLELIRQNRGNLGIGNLEIVAELPSAEVRFDRILVDAPRVPTPGSCGDVESRWRLNAEELPRLAERQLGILQKRRGAAEGGEPSSTPTCSLEREENWTWWTGLSGGGAGADWRRSAAASGAGRSGWRLLARLKRRVGMGAGAEFRFSRLTGGVRGRVHGWGESRAAANLRFYSQI